MALSEQDRNKVYVECNCFEWPAALLELKPDDLTEIEGSVRMRHPHFEAIWKLVHQCTSIFGRSQAWWLRELKRTPEEHAEWWLSNYEQGQPSTKNEEPSTPAAP